MIAITGATGQLGRLVIDALLRQGAEPPDIVALVRDPAKARALPAGVVIRHGDYGDRASLNEALKGVDKLLLISSSEIGQRTAQHQNVIDAARAAGVRLVVYTSLLHADTSPLGLAAEHLATEKALRESGLQHALLRNGWYTENYAGQLAGAVERGVIAGSAGSGRIASAARADYAEAAARVMLQDGQAGKVYELAGDDAYTLAELAAEAVRVSGKPVAYADMPEADYAKLLAGAGLPPPIAEMLADSDTGASAGALFDDGKQLSQLIGHATTPWKQTVAESLR